MKPSRWIYGFLVGLLAILFSIDNFGITYRASGEVSKPTITLNVTQRNPDDSFRTLRAFEKLMQDNGGCALPCWWGLVLGKTKQDDWFKFLDELPFTVFRVDPLPNGTMEPLDYGYFSFPQSTNTWYLRYDFHDEMLSKVSIEISEPNRLLSKDVSAILLPGLLKRLNQLNQTPEIYMFIGSYSSLNLPFLVVADDVGVIAQYEFKIVVSSSEPNNMHKWQYCLGLEQTNRIEITVQDPNMKPSVSDKERKSIDAKESPHWVRLEDLNITPIDHNEFIQFFIDHPDRCYIPNSMNSEATKTS